MNVISYAYAKALVHDYADTPRAEDLGYPDTAVNVVVDPNDDGTTWHGDSPGAVIRADETALTDLSEHR